MSQGVSPSRRVELAPGLLVALIVFCIYAGVALSVDFPTAAFGIQSDEATYYMMGHSLASDGDLVYRREDYGRVLREFPAGPSGLFLKIGRDLDVRMTGAFPFIDIESRPDPDTAQLYFGKSYIYPLAASPFVFLFGTNGFLVFHALLLGAMVLAAYLFLAARSPAPVALTLGAGFFMASVAPAYFVWITPELFNLALVVLGYFCWLYKEVVAPDAAPRGTRWLLGPASNWVAAVLLGLATFSKPSNILLMGPMLIWLLAGRRWRAAFVTGALFATVGAVLLAGNIAVTGEWNFQGGERRTFYGPYPFQNQAVQWEGVGQGRATNRVLTEVIFDPRVFGTVFSHNVAYFFVGRNAGLVPYFFPGVFALVAFLVTRRDRRSWQWLVAGAALAEILLLIIWVPYTFNGGGGSIGNRYFMNTYGVLLFLIPPIGSAWLAVAPWLVGTLFCAQVTFNPFFSAFNPAEHQKQGPLRMLPVELTLVNDLPINTEVNRARIWFGVQRRFQIYFLDDNAFAREDLSFWTRGRSRAEVLVKTVEAASSLDLTLQAGAIETRVTVTRGWWKERVALKAGESRLVRVPLDAGFPYQGTRVWHVSVEADSGFVPAFVNAASEDNRFLGVRVTPELQN
jgi:hypothetical protein